ncbi:undecaprenyl-diphosphatase [Mariniphaga anaerophila]|uniref:Undecaprenyl-diphosphatase n=1 Tax=Mariniphaga anaerophila TaxID=1484053 RepID=A0A1M4YER4_9BACT|nr:phosphatase PAP2 family protein [Mariniphaga anaerophila]SHF03946.1 undecaprenyl-diphosphatase [Mariniphaga anaerophila]
MAYLQKILDFDTEFFLYLNSFHNDFWDTIMLMVTRKETWIPFFAVILFFVFKNFKSKWWLVVVFVALTILLADQLSVLLKETIQRLRPVYNPEIEHLVHNVLRKGGLHGFVSSHAANSFALFALSTRLFKNKGYWFLMLFWAVLFSYSRIYSGVHYPLDILGGAVLGWLVGVATYKALMFFEVHFFLARNPKIKSTGLAPGQSGIIFLVFSVLAVTVVIMTSILHHYNYL